MRFYTTIEHPLRIYMEEESPGEMTKLLFLVNSKYSPPENSYNDEDELDSLIFYDEYLERHYSVRGLLQILLREASLAGITCTNEVPLEENDIQYPDIDKYLLEGIELRNYQTEGISSALAHKKGIIQVHTGGGKTEMMIGVSTYLMQNSDMNILICVPTTNLLYQTYERMLKRGISDKDVSLLGDGNKIDTSRRIVIATVQSAYSKLSTSPEYKDWVSNLNCLMMDEAHHSKCRTWSALIDSIAPEYLLGFTAEPFHKDKDHIVSDLVLRGLLGPIIHRITMDYLIEHGYLARPYVLAVDTSYKGNIMTVINWAVVNKSGIIQNTLRNNLIRDIASYLININKKPLILVQQIAHGKELASLISKLGYNVYMMQGGLKVSVYSNGTEIDNYVDNENIVLKKFNEGQIDALIGTSTLDEGADIPSLSSVILAGGGKARLRTVQKVGRSLRPKETDNTAIIIDFRDRFNIVTKSHFNKRKSLYDELGIPVYFTEGVSGIEQILNDISKKADQP